MDLVRVNLIFGCDPVHYSLVEAEFGIQLVRARFLHLDPVSFTTGQPIPADGTVCATHVDRLGTEWLVVSRATRICAVLYRNILGSIFAVDHFGVMIPLAIVDVMDVDVPRLIVRLPEVAVGSIRIHLKRLTDIQNLTDVTHFVTVQILDPGRTSHFERAEGRPQILGRDPLLVMYDRRMTGSVDLTVSGSPPEPRVLPNKSGCSPREFGKIGRDTPVPLLEPSRYSSH
jgi:hypothetical protein